MNPTALALSEVLVQGSEWYRMGGWCALFIGGFILAVALWSVRR